MNAELLNILKKAMKAEPVSPALLPEPRDEDGDRAALGPGGHA